MEKNSHNLDNKFNIESTKETAITNSSKMLDTDQEISKRQEIIDNTMSNLNSIRLELGLGASNEIPPSIKQIQESIDKLKNTIEYLNEIPVEKGKYYRVTGISEILSIIKNKALNKPTESFFDRQILNQISKNSQYSNDELELINAQDPKKIRELYDTYVKNPNNEKGTVTLNARSKSNHGDIGFVKEGFFYDPNGSKHFGAPVIAGSQEKSKFQKGVHGSHENVYNEEIDSGTPVILKDGVDAANFEYWLHEKNKGWYKNNFEELEGLFSKEIINK